MSDLQQLHTQAKKLILTFRAGLERLESLEHGGGAAVPQGLVSGLRTQLALLQKLSSDMDASWRMHLLREPASRADVWKRKVEQVSEEADSLRIGLEKFHTRQQRRHLDDAHRQELLDRRAGGGGVINVDDELAARQHISNSRRVLAEAYETGAAVLGSMGAQRETLKGAHRRALDVLNAVGLSDSLLRLVERRLRVDRAIVYGGMLATLVLVALLWWWAKGR